MLFTKRDFIFYNKKIIISAYAVIIIKMKVPWHLLGGMIKVYEVEKPETEGGKISQC